jgi:hypothetical protein
MLNAQGVELPAEVAEAVMLAEEIKTQLMKIQVRAGPRRAPAETNREERGPGRLPPVG